MAPEAQPSARARADARRAWGLGCGSLVLLALVLAFLAWRGPAMLRSLAFLALLLVAAFGYFAVGLSFVSRFLGLGGGLLASLEMGLRAWIARFTRDPEGYWIFSAGQVASMDLGFLCLERAAALGPRGAFELGLAWRERGFEDLAVHGFRSAAEQGHGPAMFHLVESLRWGPERLKDPGEADRWEARLKGMPPQDRRAHSVLRARTAETDRQGRDPEDLLDLMASRPWFPWLALAAFLLVLPVIGVYLAIATLVFAPVLWLALRFITGPDGRMGGSMKRLVARAEAGDAEAALALARFYLEGGQGLPRDALSAQLWFRRAAEAGHPEAMAALARMLSTGHGGPADPAQARSWFEAAAQAGHPDASAWVREHPASGP
ncbi:MAG TPA: tetratricopeptide repeat protein [Holophagaceae bacterium]|nr:tetratricopeptide repeat protein [Holophagaceae bacterium]